jgi:hypothetical protein
MGHWGLATFKMWGLASVAPAAAASFNQYLYLLFHPYCIIWHSSVGSVLAWYSEDHWFKS